MKDRSDDASHHERTLLLRSYISFPQNMGDKKGYKMEACLIAFEY